MPAQVPVPVPAPVPLHDADDVQRIFGISRSSAYRLLKSGAFPVIRLGRFVRVHPDDLLAYIEAQRKGVNA